jgi:CRP-like cAMP-binding protein
MSALDGLPHSASSTTIGDADVVLLPGETFRGLLGANARLAVAVALRLIRELRRSVRERVDLEAYDVPARLAGQLVDLADRLGPGAGEVELPISQRELAESCGASREAVTKALAAFRTRGWVRTGRRSITVVNVEALRTRAP